MEFLKKWFSKKMVKKWLTTDWRVGIVWLVFIFNFYFTLNLTPLFDLDEGAFAEATREMFLKHNFITTYLNGELRFDKPILIYWLQGIAVALFGEESWVFRLPSALATTGWGLVLYLFATHLYSRRVGFYTLLLFSTTLQIGIIGRAAIADSLLNLWLGVTLFSLYLYISEIRKFSESSKKGIIDNYAEGLNNLENRNNRPIQNSKYIPKEYTNNHKLVPDSNFSDKWLLIAFTATGFGFLTKGPVAIVVPIVPLFLYLLIRRQLSLFFKIVLNPKGIGIFILIALPWYIAEYLQQGKKFIDGFFFYHNLKRFNTSFESHSGSLFYYIPIILVGLLPWTTILLAYLWRIKKWVNEDFGLFATLTFGWVFFLFSLSGTKLPHYIIYGYTPLFVVMGHILANYSSRLKLSLPMTIFLLLLLFLPFIARSLLPILRDPFVKTAIITLLPYFNHFYFGIVLGLIGLILYPFPPALNRLFLGISAVIMVNYLLWIYAHFIQFPIYHLAKWIKKNPPSQKIVMWHLNTPTFILYSHRFVERREPKEGDIVLTRVSDLGKLPGFKILFKEGGIGLVRVVSPHPISTPFNYRRDKRE